MNAPSDPDLKSLPTHGPTLEEAIEYCVLALERGEGDLEALPSKFPRWKKEIEEFLTNWGGVEDLAVGLSDSVELSASLNAKDCLPRDFGEFELVEKIGSGGMGSIYKARKKNLDRFVAIKILRRDPGEAARFRMEAEAAAALAHPNIVSIYEVGITDGSPWLCMQYIEGCNLKQYIDRHDITPSEAARITRTIALGVSHAHQRGVLHRDLKPANVLMDAHQQPYVTDFGLAKLIKSDTDVTQSGTILGTPGYMSPEQASGKVRNLTVATDVYGLGALLFALLTGDAPFTGDSSLQILRRVVEEPAASPRFKNTDVDKDLATICLKCLEKSPELRYHSAEALADDLERYLDGKPVFARPISSSERFIRWCQRNPAIAALSGAVILLMMATTVFASFLAFSERNSRMLGEENARRESRLRKEAISAFEKEREASQTAYRTQINLLTTNALWQAKNKNVGEALLWFTEAAGLSGDDAGQVRKLLIHYQSWLNQHPLPVAAMLLPPEFCNIEDMDELRCRHDDSILMYRSRSSYVIWDHKHDRRWYLNNILPNLVYAIWDADGNSILAGCRDGLVVALDLESRQVREIASVDGSVNRLVLLDQNRKLGVLAGKQLSVFELASGARVGDVVEQEGTLLDATTNQDGSRLVCTDNSKQAIVYAVDRSGFRKIRKHTCSYYSMVDGRRSFWPMFVKHGQALLIRTAENNVVAFDIETGKSLGQIELTFPIHSCCVSSDGDVVLSGGFNHAHLLRLGDIEPSDSADANDCGQLQVVQDDQVPQEERVSAVSVGTNGLFATGGWNNEVRLWRTRTPKSYMNQVFDLPEKVVPLAVLPHQNRLRRIQFTPDGSSLVTVQIDGLIRVWKIPDFQPSGTSLMVEPGGSLVKSVDADRWMTSGISQWTGHMQNAAAFFFRDGAFAGGTFNQSRRVIGHLLDAACSPDCTQLATVHAITGRTTSSAGSLRLWSMPLSNPIGEPIPMPSEPRWVAYRPDGQQLAVCTARLEILLVNTKTHEVEGMLDTFGDEKNRLTETSIFAQNPINEQAIYSPDGSLLIAWSTRKSGLGVWDVESRSLKFPRLHTEQPPLSGISLSPDGKHLAMAGGQSTLVTILDLETGVVQERQFPHPSYVHSVEFSPDGNSILTGCRDGHARLIDWRTGKIQLDQMSHDADVVAATFTHDSNFVLTLGLDNQLRVWHASVGSLAVRPIDVPAGSSQLLVSQDSKHVVIAGGHILNVDLSELQQEPWITLPRARQISELLANKTIINGEPHSLSAQEWIARWQEYADN
jgi:serine/threonine protein kinase/WD40 repeat protein